MAEWGTYSSAIDTVVSRSGRLDRRDDCIDFVNQTILETQARAFFKNDLVEERLHNTAGASPFVTPEPLQFRQMQSVRYTDAYSPRGEPIYPKHIEPSQSQRDYDYFWYGSGGMFVFAGAASMVDIAYFSYLPPLAYHPEVQNRPAIYDSSTRQWMYNSDETLTELQKRSLVTNWLVFRFFNTIVQGGLAKLWNITQDPRSVAAYASYKQGQLTILQLQAREHVGGR